VATKRKRVVKTESDDPPIGRPTRSIAPAKRARTQSELFAVLSDATGVPRRKVKQILDTLAQVLAADLSKGPGELRLGSIAKFTVKRLPATPERRGLNPFTKEETVFKAKPARKVVKVRPLKGLKSMV
jgi:nucleoid DNA-binding protein